MSNINYFWDDLSSHLKGLLDSAHLLREDVVAQARHVTQCHALNYTFGRV